MISKAVPDTLGALNKLQSALDSGIVKLTPCDLHPELGLLVDQPDDRLRFTFALTEDGKVISTALFVVLRGQLHGLPCLHAGYAVIDSRRNAGIGSRTMQQAIEELRNGLCRQNLGSFFLEAIVPADDEPANKIARKLLSSSPQTGTDDVSGQSVHQYIKKIECNGADVAP